MKKTALILAGFMFLINSSAFGLIHVGVNAGYAYANYADVGNAWETVKQKAQDADYNVRLDTFGNCIYANADISVSLLPAFDLSLRTGGQWMLPVTYQSDIGDVLQQKDTINSYLVPLQLGLGLSFEIDPGSMWVIVTGHAGYGFSAMTVDRTYGNDPSIEPEAQGQNFLFIYDGGGFMYDISAQVEWKFLSIFRLQVNAGYRTADIRHMNLTSKVEVPGYGIIFDAGEELTNIAEITGTATKMSVDFSGILLGIGLSVGF
ncbi:MAG TPA: hypothetical protein ENN55_01770 [Firmicutes bacterium]|nr:hypothetical protein [Bacillota bacterium]